MGKKKEFLNSIPPSEANFEWSLKPITVLMAMFGQEIVIVGNNNSRRKMLGKPIRSNLILMIGLSILASNIFINILSFKKVNSRYQSEVIVSYVSHLITHLFHDLMVIGMPLSFMIVRFFNHYWKDLLNTLEMIQFEMNLSKQVHKEIRNSAIFTILFFLTDASVWMYRSINQTYWTKIPNCPYPLAVTLGNLSYMSASSVLFATMLSFLFVPIILLEELKMRMNNILIHESHHSSPIKLSTELENWRKHHDLVCCLAHNINQCFGPCLLIFLINATNIFITYTSQSVLMYEKINNGETIASHILKFVIVLVELLVILYPAQKLKDEGERIAKMIQQIHLKKNRQLKIQLQTIGLQVSQSRLKITAMDIIDCDFPLISSLLGFSLSYSIILYQTQHGSVNTSVNNTKHIKSKHLVKPLVTTPISSHIFNISNY